MTAAVLDRPVWRIADDPRSSEELIAEAAGLIDRTRTCCARLAGCEVALDAGDVALGRRLLAQALDDLHVEGGAA